MKKVRKKYTAEFRQQAVALMDDPDKSNEQVARELGVEISLLYKWRKKLRDHGDLAFPGHGNSGPDDELARLRRELAQVKQERDFLRKAAAYFAQESP